MPQIDGDTTNKTSTITMFTSKSINIDYFGDLRDMVGTVKTGQNVIFNSKTLYLIEILISKWVATIL